jgi:hypothetical protein
MRLNEFDSYNWRVDVEAFARWCGFYDMTRNNETKRRAFERLEELQAKWPHHKLGDMPNDNAA